MKGECAVTQNLPEIAIGEFVIPKVAYKAFSLEVMQRLPLEVIDPSVIDTRIAEHFIVNALGDSIQRPQLRDPLSAAGASEFLQSRLMY